MIQVIMELFYTRGPMLELTRFKVMEFETEAEAEWWALDRTIGSEFPFVVMSMEGPHNKVEF